MDQHPVGGVLRHRDPAVVADVKIIRMLRIVEHRGAANDQEKGEPGTQGMGMDGLTPPPPLSLPSAGSRGGAGPPSPTSLLCPSPLSPHVLAPVDKVLPHRTACDGIGPVAYRGAPHPLPRGHKGVLGVGVPRVEAETAKGDVLLRPPCSLIQKWLAVSSVQQLFALEPEGRLIVIVTSPIGSPSSRPRSHGYLALVSFR